MDKSLMSNLNDLCAWHSEQATELEREEGGGQELLFHLLARETLLATIRNLEGERA